MKKHRSAMVQHRTVFHEERIISDERTKIFSGYVVTQACLWSWCCVFFLASVGTSIALIIVARSHEL